MPGQKSEGFMVDAPNSWYNRKEARSYESNNRNRSAKLCPKFIDELEEEKEPNQLV